LRRWRLASGVFGLALVVVSAAVLGRLPALSHALPSAADASLAFVVALACAVGSGWCAVKTARQLARATPGRPVAVGLEPVAAKG
jgi:hypothetical protein